MINDLGKLNGTGVNYGVPKKPQSVTYSWLPTWSWICTSEQHQYPGIKELVIKKKGSNYGVEIKA